MKQARLAISLAAIAVGAPTASALPPSYDKIVVVVLENVNASEVIGQSYAPYINQLAAEGANFSEFYAFYHTSPPNYGEMFAGEHNSLFDGLMPPAAPLTTPNLAASLAHVGKAFAGYSQTLPAAGSTVFDAYPYTRRHNPWVNWQNDAIGAHPNQLPGSYNQPFTAFPADFATLPPISFVVPDNHHNMHDGSSLADRVTRGDNFLRDYLDAYYQWARTHNSLLIVTADEDNRNLNNNHNRIPTIFAGAHVRAGATVAQPYTLHDLLRTLEDRHGTAHSGAAAFVAGTHGAFASDVPSTSLVLRQGVGGYAGTRDTQLRADQPDTNFATLHKIPVSRDDNAAAGDQPSMMLIRFDDLVTPARVPAGATVLSAKLALTTNQSLGAETNDTVGLHRMLTDWSVNSTWNSLGAGVSTDGIEARTTPDFADNFYHYGHPYFFDVTRSVQAYADGSANYGWALIGQGTDGSLWNTSDPGIELLQERPALNVTYALLPRWNSVVSGSWGDNANWSFGIPDGGGASARLSLESPIASPLPLTLRLGQTRTLGSLALAAGTSYRIDGEGQASVVLDNGGIAPAVVQVSAGSHVIDAPISIADHARVEVSHGTALQVMRTTSLLAGRTLTKTGPGGLRLARLEMPATAALRVHEGQVEADAIGGAGSLFVARSAALKINGTASLASLELFQRNGAWEASVDLAAGRLTLLSTPAESASRLAMLTDMIRSGRNGGTWDGPGIRSSAITSLTTLGVIRNANADGSPVHGNYAGAVVDADDLLAGWTYLGDLNLDGRVDIDDYFRIDIGYVAGLSGYQWGDVDYSLGPPDAEDYFLVDQAYLGQGAPLGNPPAAVPEPAGLLCLAGALGLLSARRRR